MDTTEFSSEESAGSAADVEKIGSVAMNENVDEKELAARLLAQAREQGGESGRAGWSVVESDQDGAGNGPGG